MRGIGQFGQCLYAFNAIDFRSGGVNGYYILVVPKQIFERLPTTMSTTIPFARNGNSHFESIFGRIGGSTDHRKLGSREECDLLLVEGCILGTHSSVTDGKSRMGTEGSGR